MLVVQTIQERDIVKPMSSERARATYLESQIQDMSGVWLLLNIPLMKEESHMPTDLTKRIHMFCKE